MCRTVILACLCGLSLFAQGPNPAPRTSEPQFTLQMCIEATVKVAISMPPQIIDTAVFKTVLEEAAIPALKEIFPYVQFNLITCSNSIDSKSRRSTDVRPAPSVSRRLPVLRGKLILELSALQRSTVGRTLVGKDIVALKGSLNGRLDIETIGGDTVALKKFIVLPRSDVEFSRSDDPLQMAEKLRKVLKEESFLELDKDIYKVKLYQPFFDVAGEHTADSCIGYSQCLEFREAYPALWRWRAELEPASRDRNVQGIFKIRCGESKKFIFEADTAVQAMKITRIKLLEFDTAGSCSK